jgi:hypothetical protein
MNKTIIISLMLFGILKFFSCNGQSEKQSTNPSTEEILKSFDDFMNRPMYKILTKEILNSIPNNNLEQAVIDNIYEQLGHDYEEEFSLVQKE